MQYRKSIKEQQIDFLFPLNLDCIKLCDSCDICDSCDSCVTAKGFFPPVSGKQVLRVSVGATYGAAEAAAPFAETLEIKFLQFVVPAQQES